jgi:iron(III) transport system ATP-binding protein
MRHGAEGRALVVEYLVKVYQDRRDRVRAVDGVSFEVQEGQFYTLLGPSGCGKTTTLRCVAGLERTDAGRIIVDSHVVSSHAPRVFVPPHKRSIGMVFQSYAIWPHMTVFENVAFPLRVGRERLSGGEIKHRVEEALATVQLAGYEGRMATQLSGGQQQRLALARALVRRPKVLLLDEPLSNLDAKLREHMRAELRTLQRRLGITTLYVTHDQVEGLSMSNRIAVMSNGKIVQESTPREIYQRPANRFVADFVGSTNFLEAELLGSSEVGGMRLQTTAGQIQANCPEGVQSGERVTVSIRPESIRLHRVEPAAVNVLPGVVEQQMFLGNYLDCRVRVGEAMLLTRQDPTLALRRGERVYVELPVDLCTVLSDAHGVSAATYLGEEPLASSELEQKGSPLHDR